MIGRGGSSKVKHLISRKTKPSPNKTDDADCFLFYFVVCVSFGQVYQVLDHKKQLFAVKYVDLEVADAQTIESYKNEIEHLNHLQQYSDQIIKLYDL